MARNRCCKWGQSSSDHEEPAPSPAKAAQWGADSSDGEFRCSGASTGRRKFKHCSDTSDSLLPKRARNWLVQESESSDGDIWRRPRNVGGVHRHDVKKATAKPRLWTKGSSSSSDCESPGAQGSSGVPRPAKGSGKPVVDLTLGVMQLKSNSFNVREDLTSFEAWGIDEKRLKLVCREPVCKCKIHCHKQLPLKELSNLCSWYHAHLTYSERQFVIQTLYHQAINCDSSEVMDNHPRTYVQWRLQGCL